jgi:hypothetical protein
MLKNLCYGTLYCPWMSINVNVFLELVCAFYRPSSVLHEIEILPFRWVIKRFPCWNRQILTEWHIIASSAMLWVIYVCSDVLNEHELVCREHLCIWSSWLTCWSLWPSGYEVELRNRRPGIDYRRGSFFFFFFGTLLIIYGYTDLSTFKIWRRLSCNFTFPK